MFLLLQITYVILQQNALRQIDSYCFLLAKPKERNTSDSFAIVWYSVFYGIKKLYLCSMRFKACCKGIVFFLSKRKVYILIF